MEKKLTEEEIRELEQQLSCPSGEFGIELGKAMNESNIGMTLNSIQYLELEKGNVVLELGYGNCGHLDHLLKAANGISYHGLEISETMWSEAEDINANKNAEFQLYDGESIPFEKDFFDLIFSVNTIYFWSKPEQLIKEIERCLKPEGICVLTYAEKEFMKKLPFVGDKFKLFEIYEMETLVAMSNMEIEDFEEKTDQATSKAGEKVDRNFTMAKIIKQK